MGKLCAQAVHLTGYNYRYIHPQLIHTDSAVPVWLGASTQDTPSILRSSHWLFAYFSTMKLRWIPEVDIGLSTISTIPTTTTTILFSKQGATT